MDLLADGTMLILDYKTGHLDPMPQLSVANFDVDLSREKIRRMVKSFQIPLYFYFFSKRYPQEKINACFYSLRTLHLEQFVDDNAAVSLPEVNEIFFNALSFIIKEILDPKVPFSPDVSDPRYCATCPFFYMCR